MGRVSEVKEKEFLKNVIENKVMQKKNSRKIINQGHRRRYCQ